MKQTFEIETEAIINADHLEEILNDSNNVFKFKVTEISTPELIPEEEVNGIITKLEKLND